MKSLDLLLIQLKGRYPKLFLILLLLCLLIVILNSFLPPAVDWINIYRPAALALINGKSPYSVDRFSNAPWILLPILPLLLLPESLGRAVLALSAIISLIFIGIKFGAKPLSLLFFLVSPPIISLMLDGNIDWIVAIGFVLPPQLGLFFLAIKPQIGIAVIAFWVWESWKKGGYREVLRVFSPVVAALLISFMVWGLWPMNFNKAFDWGGNASLWPVSLPLGLALFTASVRKKGLKLAISASPCFSPYVLLHSWIGPLIAILASTPELIAAVIGMWLLVGIRAL